MAESNKNITISTQVKVGVEVEVELGKIIFIWLGKGDLPVRFQYKTYSVQ